MANNRPKLRTYTEYYPHAIPFDPREGMDVFRDIPIAPVVEDISTEFKKKNCYMSNIKIMKAGVEIEYTKEQLMELKKCKNDFLYFIVNYCKIITLDGGISLFKLFQYQKNALKIMHENRFSIFKFPRQMGKCYDEDTELQIKINEEEIILSAKEMYSLVETDNRVESYTPNYKYDILTEDGFKPFDGITTRVTNELIEIVFEDGKNIRVTPDHEIKDIDMNFIKASDIKVGDVLGGDVKSTVKLTRTLVGEFKVADMIAIQDTQSFVVDDIGAILSNCVDGDSIVTLLDNVTGEKFNIHVDELFDFLYQGSIS